MPEITRSVQLRQKPSIDEDLINTSLIEFLVIGIKLVIKTHNWRQLKMLM